MKILTIVLTHNSPNQLSAFFDRIGDRAPEFLAKSRVLVLDQSDSAGVPSENTRICENYGAEHISRANRGASGGRFAAAEVFHQSDADALFFFEDDMLLWDDRQLRCRFGFPNHVRNLFEKAVRVLESERLDYLKLTFHEVYSNHSLNFYDGTPSRFDKLGSVDNEIGYFVGQVYYSNWPMLITRAGSLKLFFPPAVTEGDVVRRAARLQCEGGLVTGVLAAFPICHTRIEPRPGRADLLVGDERVEPSPGTPCDETANPWSSRPGTLRYVGDISRQDAQVLAEYAAVSHRILEFGVGGSTQVLAQLAPPGASVTAVETDQHWVSVTQQNLRRLTIRADVQFMLYPDWLSLDVGLIDMAFVDGVDHLRLEFADRAWGFLRVGGVLLIHDTRRATDVNYTLELVKRYHLEVERVELNVRASNITVIHKKIAEPYVNWNAVEALEGG